MRVEQVMTTRPFTVRVGTTTAAALHLLVRHAVTALPVVDDRGRLVGIVSEADLLPGPLVPDPAQWSVGPAAPALANRPTTLLVGDVMTRATVLVHPETDLFEVGRILGESSFRSLPVVDASHQVVGVVSRSDVVRALARDDETLAEESCDALVSAGRHGFRVRVRNGVAQVSAVAEVSHEEVAAALSVVAATPGVLAVHAEPVGTASRAAGTFGPVGRAVDE